MRKWLPRRSKDERSEDIAFGLSDVAIAFCILSAGLIGVVAGAYIDEGAVLGIGMLVACIGVYALGQSLVGLLIDMTLGMGGLGFVLIVLILGFFLVQGYGLLMTP